MSAQDLKNYLKGYYADGSYDHMVFPGMVYISFPTEYGTLYSKKELTDIYAVCQEYSLPLFVDGARLGYGLMSPACDITIQDLARLCDVFTIGGTKVGALCGEAVVFPSGKAPEHFFTMVKQHGALVAKGRLLGVQFDTLFTDGLYFKIAQGAIDLAMQLKKLFLDKGYELFLDSPTNQQFIILTPAAAKALEGKVAYEVWETLPDGRKVVRFATSWATTPEQVSQLSALLP
jgi:threonine aldolase